MSSSAKVEWIINNWKIVICVMVVIGTLGSLMKNSARADLKMLAALGVLLLTGVLPADRAFVGLSNPAVIAIGALFVIAACVQKTGALWFVDRWLFPDDAPQKKVLTRLMFGVAGLSAFLNNTPIVAMLIPRVQAWCEKKKISASQLMIPLSYAAILGGMTTLVGTSTNLIVSGLLESAGKKGLGMFDIAWVGVPAVIIVGVYFSYFGERFLPNYARSVKVFKEGLRHLLFEVRVGEDSPLEGKTIKEAELRDLKSAYLAHIRRDDRLIPSSPESILQVGDILAFQGNASLIDELNEKYGLSRVGPELEESQGSTMPLFEAVIAPTSFLVGRTLRDAQFRERYNGVVLGIQRREMPLRGPLGRVALQTGDLLLIEAPKGFDRQWNEKRDEFYLVAPRKTKAPKEQSGKGPIAITILGLVILAATLGWAPISVTAFIGALALLGLHLMTPKEAGDSVDISVLTVIAAALGIGEAISASGLADLIGNMLAQWAGVLGPIGAIAILYLATNLLTELITNNAAAALMVPVGLSVAEQMTINPVAIAITIAVAASASFMTPIGYQTNMMVMAAGAYHFNDFFRIGFRVNLIVGALTIAIVAWKWL